MPGGSFSWREFMRYLDKSREAFDRDVSLSTTNEADISGEYPYNPERWRFYVNGTRQLLQYGTVPEHTQEADYQAITPQAEDDTVTLQSAERFRYVVQFVIEWSLALTLNQELQSGDVLVVGYGDPDLANATGTDPFGPAADGWFVSQEGADAVDEAVISEVRAGTVVEAQPIKLNKLFQTQGRLAGETNWYNVGETAITETDTIPDQRGRDQGPPGNRQRNDRLGRVASNDGRGPEGANKHLTVSLKAGVDGAGTTTAEVGSMGLRTLGDVTALLRRKSAIDEVTVENGDSGTYEPVFAMRVDPDRRYVNTQLRQVLGIEFGGNADIAILTIAADPSNTDASGFDTPEQHAETNSVLEVTDSVTTFPDTTGAEVSTATNPGGYQLSYDTLFTAGSGQESVSPATDRVAKRSIHNGDIAIVLANAAGTGDLTIQYQVEQDW